MTGVAHELAMFLATVLSGMVLGLLYDIHRALTHPPRPRRRLRPRQFVLDILFWLVVTPLAFVLLVVASLGQLQWHVYLGLAVGLGLYAALGSPLLLTCFRFVVVGARTFLHRLRLRWPRPPAGGRS